MQDDSDINIRYVQCRPSLLIFGEWSESTKQRDQLLTVVAQLRKSPDSRKQFSTTPQLVTDWTWLGIDCLETIGCEWHYALSVTQARYDGWGWWCLFVCLGFNGTFSTNRLYRAIKVGNISRRGRRQQQKNIIKQWSNTINQENHMHSSAWAFLRRSPRHD